MSMKLKHVMHAIDWDGTTKKTVKKISRIDDHFVLLGYSGEFVTSLNNGVPSCLIDLTRFPDDNGRLRIDLTGRRVLAMAAMPGIYGRVNINPNVWPYVLTPGIAADFARQRKVGKILSGGDHSGKFPGWAPHPLFNSNPATSAGLAIFHGGNSASVRFASNGPVISSTSKHLVLVSDVINVSVIVYLLCNYTSNSRFSGTNGSIDTDLFVNTQ